MSSEVCFEFCRTVPDMNFFGLIYGRECYCAPYFKMTSGDTSECDAVCEGKPTEMCGGMAKSSIFEMHLCANTAEKLTDLAKKAGKLKTIMNKAAKLALKDANNLQDVAARLQDSFGA